MSYVRRRLIKFNGRNQQIHFQNSWRLIILGIIFEKTFGCHHPYAEYKLCVGKIVRKKDRKKNTRSFKPPWSQLHSKHQTRLRQAAKFSKKAEKLDTWGGRHCTRTIWFYSYQEISDNVVLIWAWNYLINNTNSHANMYDVSRHLAISGTFISQIMKKDTCDG